MPLPEQVILVNPRGECFGVKRAVRLLQEVIDETSKWYPEPEIVCVNSIVHNAQRTDFFETQGVTFITPDVAGKAINELDAVYKDVLDRIDRNAILLSSAHGVPPSFYQAVKDLDPAKYPNIDRYADLTCPMVKKVQGQAEKALGQGKKAVYLGVKDHPEAISVLGIDPDNILLVEKPDDVDNLPPMAGELVRLNQTTLSESLLARVDMRLKDCYGDGISFESDRCLATRNRQEAVTKLAEVVDIVLVVGSGNSQNAQELVNCAAQVVDRQHRKAMHPLKIEDVHGLKREWERLKNSWCRTIGITASASTPPESVNEIVNFLEAEGVSLAHLSYPGLQKGEPSEWDDLGTF